MMHMPAFIRGYGIWYLSSYLTRLFAPDGSIIRRCNGVIDCPNAADEKNCTRMTKMFMDYATNVASEEASPRSHYTNDTCILADMPTTCSCSYGTQVTCRDISLVTIPQNIRPAGQPTKLDLSNNIIREIEAEAFNGLLMLKRLWIPHNQISYLAPGLFSDVPQLSMVYMDFNQLVDWDPDVFRGNHSIKWIDVRHNRIQLRRKDMLLHLSSAFKYLEFDNNEIAELDSDSFGQIGSLNVLSLANNPIKRIALDTFASLKLYELILSNTSIEAIPEQLFANQTLLEDLDLSGVPAQFLPEKVFYGLPQLVNLKLERVKIQNISKKMFADSDFNIEHIHFEKFHYCGYVPRVKDCSPKTDGLSSAEYLLDSVVLKVFGWLIGILAFFFNGFVLCLRWCLWKVSDSLMGLYMLILATADVIYKKEYYKYSHLWVHSSLCRFSGLLSVVSSEVSTLLLVFMAIERYARLVWKPFGRSGTTLRTTVVWISGCWILGISSGLIPLIADLYADDIQLFYSHNGACLPMFIHEPYLKRWWISLIIFVITPVSAIVLISLCYLGIFLHVEQSRQDSERSRADKSHLKKVLAITVSNNFSWITIIVIKVLALFGVDIPTQMYGWMAVFILPVNCCLNPIIYTIMTPDFRSLLHKLPTKFSRSRAEAKALQQIVYYASVNSFSRNDTLRSLGKSPSCGTAISNIHASNRHSFIGFSRQSSALSTAKFCNRSGKHRRPVLPMIDASSPTQGQECVSDNSEDDRGLIMKLVQGNPLPSGAQWDC